LRATLLAILVTQCVSSIRGVPRACRSNLETRKVPAEDKIDRCRDVGAGARILLVSLRLLHREKNRGAARTQKLATERPYEAAKLVVPRVNAVFAHRFFFPRKNISSTTILGNVHKSLRTNISLSKFAILFFLLLETRGNYGI